MSTVVQYDDCPGMDRIVIETWSVGPRIVGESEVWHCEVSGGHPIRLACQSAYTRLDAIRKAVGAFRAQRG